MEKNIIQGMTDEPPSCRWDSNEPTLNDIDVVVNKLDNNKFSGSDGIHSDALKFEGGPIFERFNILIYNRWILIGLVMF